jgi:hypothetical protein
VDLVSTYSTINKQIKQLTTTNMSTVSRIADFAQRTVTLTLIAWMGFQAYQIGKNVNEGWVRQKETGFFEELKKRREEDAKNDDRIDVLPSKCIV